MVTLSKVTTNHAERRGFELEVCPMEDRGGCPFTAILVYEADVDSEPMMIYRANNDGSFSWYGRVYLARNIIEELPAHIPNEAGFRKMIHFLKTALDAKEASKQAS